MKRFFAFIIGCFIQLVAFAQRVRPELDLDDGFHYSTDTQILDRIIFTIGVIFIVVGIIARIVHYIKEDPKERAFRKEVKKAIEGGWVYVFKKDMTYTPHYNETLNIPKGTKCIIVKKGDAQNDFVSIRIYANQSVKYNKVLGVSYSNLERIDKCE